MQEYTIEGCPKLMLIYDRETNPEYPWTIGPLDDNGRYMSGYTTSYIEKADAVQGALDGTWKIW